MAHCAWRTECGYSLYRMHTVTASTLYGCRRLLLALVSVALHVGIALVQSFLIGVAFLPNLGTYLLGFGAPTAAAGSAGWCAAVAVVIVSVSPLALRGRLMPD